METKLATHVNVMRVIQAINVKIAILAMENMARLNVTQRNNVNMEAHNKVQTVFAQGTGPANYVVLAKLVIQELIAINVHQVMVKMVRANVSIQMKAKIIQTATILF